MHSIAYVVFPNFQVMGFAVITVFEVANFVIGDAAYEVALLSEHGGLVQTTAGFPVQTEAFDDRVFDTVMIGPRMVIEPATPGLIDFVRRAGRPARDHTLDVRARSSAELSQYQSRRGPDLHR